MCAHPVSVSVLPRLCCQCSEQRHAVQMRMCKTQDCHFPVDEDAVDGYASRCRYKGPLAADAATGEAVKGRWVGWRSGRGELEWSGWQMQLSRFDARHLSKKSRLFRTGFKIGTGNQPDRREDLIWAKKADSKFRNATHAKNGFFFFYGK